MIAVHLKRFTKIIQNAIKTGSIRLEALWNTHAMNIIGLRVTYAGVASGTDDGTEETLFMSPVSFHSLLFYDREICRFSEHHYTVEHILFPI